MQAQRKFAQVCGGSATSTLPSNLISNQPAQNGGSKPDALNHEPPQELLPNRRPNTEDFLTFLCFRGTSVLPSHLDFFNTNKNVDQTQIKSKSDNLAASCSKTIKQDDKQSYLVKNESELTTGTGITATNTTTTAPVDNTKHKDNNEPPEFIPFAVRKRADTVAAGSRKQTVQALKKKYQEQRIAKTQVQCKTRSSAVKETETNNKMTQKPKQNNDTKNDSSVMAANETTATSNRNVKRKLRGNGGNSLLDEEVSNNKLPKIIKESHVRPNSKIAESNKTNKINTRTTKSIGSIPVKSDATDDEPDQSTRRTRHRSYSLPRPENKSNKTIDKSLNQTESPATKTAKIRNGKKNLDNEDDEEFSSDDDLPLADTKKANSKSALPAKSRRSQKRTSSKRNQSIKSTEHDKSADRKSDASSKISEPASKRKSTNDRKPTTKDINKKGGTDSQKNAPKSIESEKSGIESQEDSKKETKVVKQKRRNEFTDLSQTDQSENETRAGRPMRKTKEAAAIYMELIGQKLNLSDFDDDLSVDSFPELPNVRKTEQMENELRANLEKDKRELTSTPKRNKAKQDASTPSNLIDEKNESTTKPSESVSKADKSKTKPTETTNTEKPKLEKSFSSSDDEPLASKIERKPKSSPKKPKLSPIKKETVPEVETEKRLETPAKSVDIDISIECKAGGSSIQNTTNPQNNTMSTPVKNTSTSTEPTTKTKNTSSPPKSIDLNETEFKMPAESVKQLLSPPISVSPIKIPSIRNIITKDKSMVLPKDAALSTASGKNSSQSISAILADLMPSKEESGKIFGIASVTLAQSSGPSDTKCTLGKCGSIHKPPLGQAVPTESYLNDQMSNKDRRKAKVNMTHEQIEKWLSECSMNADPFESDSLDDFDLTSPPKPINYLQTPSPIRDNDCHKDEPTTSIKLKPQATKEKQPQVQPAIATKNKANGSGSKQKTDNKDNATVTVDDKKATVEKRSNSNLDNDKPTSAKKQQAEEQRNKSTEDLSKRSANQSIASVKTLPSPSKPNVISANTSTPDKKPIYNRRTPVYNTKKTDTLKSPPVVNSFGAFSPENEASVYSFDKEEDTLPTSLPFRRHGRRSSTHSKNNEHDLTNKNNITPLSKVGKSVKKQQNPSTNSQKDNNKSTSINAQNDKNDKSFGENMDKSKQQSPGGNDQLNVSGTTITTDNDGKDSDSESHTFYIPLQGMGSMGNAGTGSDQLIQGVAVKLGTEGPEGPNQKVIMHAKLVTKSQMSANAKPIPEGMGMANIQEIVKNLIANKEPGGASNSIPIGTIQPRIKADDKSKPSTSTAATVAIAVTAATPPEPLVAQNQATTTNLTRQNSNQSLFSQKTKTTKRSKNDHVIQPSNNTAFPRYDDPAQMVEAPVFRPTEKEFQDPIDFINRIMPVAARFGLCRIIPPSTFKPECKISDDMRFTAYNQYVHRMLHRWGPSVKELSAIRKYLTTQSITLNQLPLIGGMEVDLPRLYHTVQELGGLKEVIEKKKWARVAEEMCIPKSAQDRVTKLDDIYCKYLLPYDTLSPNERQRLFDEVEADRVKREAKARRNADRNTVSESNSNENSDEDEQSDDEDEDAERGSMECIVKGKSMALSAFFRVARNTMALWFRNEKPTSSEVEAEFWRHVAVRDSHVCAHSGSIDSSGWGYGFPSPGPKTKNSTCSKHPWNLKVLTNNHSSILRSIGPITGVTVPTLHVGMLFSACCWYRDPHGLPWIEYLHTGGSKIWYSVPNEQSSNFRSAFTSLVPTHCQNKTVWLPCDTAMVPPHLLTDRGVSLCRTEQEPGQFVVVFPRAYTSNICTGYSISESVYFATMSWLETAKDDFRVIIFVFFAHCTYCLFINY